MIFVYSECENNYTIIVGLGLWCLMPLSMGCHGCDRMVVEFITTYAISAYHH